MDRWSDNRVLLIGDVAMRAMNLGRPVAGLFAGSLRDDLDLPDYRID
ncbi:hypothetical protein [Mycobacterium sp. DL440]